MIGQSSTSITKTPNLNLCWGARSSFTPSHSHTGMQAQTHTRALAVSGTFWHLQELHSYMQHTISMFFTCTSTESVPLRWNHPQFLPQGKVKLRHRLETSCTSDPFPAVMVITVFLWKTQNSLCHFRLNGARDGWEDRHFVKNPTVIAANEGWKTLIEPGSCGSSCFVPEEGAVSGEAGPVQQPNSLNRSKKSSSSLHPHLPRLHHCKPVNQ